MLVASSLTIESDETSRDVVIFGGSLDVEGKVIGDAAVIGGSATISGEISTIPEPVTRASDAGMTTVELPAATWVVRSPSSLVKGGDGSRPRAYARIRSMPESA